MQRRRPPWPPRPPKIRVRGGCRRRRSGRRAWARSRRARHAPRLAGPQPDGLLAPGADVAATSLAWYDELRLPGALVAGLHDAGFGEGDAWSVTDRVRVLLALPRPSTLGRPGADRRRAAARRVAGPREHPGRPRHQHLGGRRVPRSRPVRGRGPLGGPSRRHRFGVIGTARPRRPAPTSGRACPQPRRRPAIASIACGQRWPRPEPRRSAARSRAGDRPRATRGGSDEGVTSAACRGRGPTRGAAGRLKPGVSPRPPTTRDAGTAAAPRGSPEAIAARRRTSCSISHISSEPAK